MSDDKKLILRSETESRLATAELLERGTILATRITIPIADADEQQANEHFGLACAYFLDDDRERAHDTLATVLRIAPRHKWAYLMRGHVRHLLGDLDGAELDFQRNIVLSPTEWEAHTDLAILYLDMRETEQGRDQYRLARTNLRVWNLEVARLKTTFEINNEIREGIASAELYVRRGKSRSYYGMAAQHGNYGSIADFNRAIRLNPHSAETYYWRSKTTMSNNDLFGAYFDGERAVELAAGNMQYAEHLELLKTKIIRMRFSVADYLTNRGWRKREHGDFHGALKDFNDAIRRNPQHAIAYNNRGVVYGRLGEHNKAMADYTAATRCDPNLNWPYNNRGEIYFESGLYDKALAEFNFACQVSPEYPTSIAGKAITLRALSRPKEAKELWKVLIQRNENYKNPEWIRTELNWDNEDILVEAARQLIAEL